MAKSRVAQRADGRYSMAIYLGRKPDGTRNYKTVYGTTPKEVEAKALEIRLAMKKGIDVTAERDTFQEWAERWKRIKETEVRSGMMNAYKSALNHLSPLNGIQIGKIRANDIQMILLSLAKNNPNTKKPSSKQTLMTAKMAADQIFQLAYDNRVIDFNPASSLKIPAPRPSERRQALTAEQQKWITDTPHKTQTAAMIMMYAGLRRGELLALTWRDIDTKNKTITVNKSVEMLKNKTELKPMTKTEAGMRIVNIPTVLADYLAQQERTALLVCPSANGDYMTPSGWKKFWKCYIADLNIKYGDFSHCISGKNGKVKKSKFDPHSKHNPNGVPIVIPQFTAHWLRHTFATMLYLAGVDILTAKDQLGHADVKTTMEIYTHLDQIYKRKSMNKLDAFLNEKNDDACQMHVKQM